MKKIFNDITLQRDKLLGTYRGVVESNVDPLEAGRVQVRVFGVHCEEKTKTPITGIPTAELPWAEPACPIMGGVSKIGMFGVPLQGSHVFLFFENGNPMNPRYFATAPGIPYRKPDTSKGFNDPDGEYPTLEHLYEPDWNKGENSTSVYPNCWTIKDPAGNMIEMDHTDGAERIIITHGKKGSTIEFTKEGSIVISSKGNTNKEFTGAKDIIVAGNYNITTDNYKSITKDTDNQIMGKSTSMITGSKNEICLATINQKAGEKNINTDGDHKCIAGGKSSLIAGGDVIIRSKENNIDMSAPLNVDIVANIGATLQGVITCDVKGLVTTVQGDVTCDVKSILTTVDGTAITMIKGGIILIG